MRRIMMATNPGGGRPGVRLGLAFAASLALHLALLFPSGLMQPRGVDVPSPIPAMLEARLVAPALATWIEEVEAAVTAPPVAVAVSPAPTSPQGAGRHVVAVPSMARDSAQPNTFAHARPAPLAGRALDAALAELTRELFYPPEAIARGLQGRVVLLLTLDATGRVIAADIASGSGHAMLDTAALEAAARIGGVPGGGRQVLLPVEFRLE